MLSSSLFATLLFIALSATCVSALILAGLLLYDWQKKQLW